MGLAYAYYICVCYGDASVRMPSLILADCLVPQSRVVFAIGQSIESRSEFCMISLCCQWGLARFMFCGMRVFESLRGGSACPIAFCMRIQGHYLQQWMP